MSRLSRQRRVVRFGVSADQTPAAPPPRRLPARAAALLLALLVPSLAMLSLSTSPVSAQEPERSSTEANTAVFSGTASSANARYVVAGYQQLLGREADVTGLDFHIGRLAAGGDRSRKAFTYAMLFSVEGSRQEVRRAYQNLLSRAPDAAGENYWTEHLQGRGVLDLRVLLMSSDEYHRGSGGTDAAWLESLYLDILGRASDETGRTYWLGQMADGVARPLIVAGLYLSDEALGRRVDAYYSEALSRTPTDGERTEAITIIRSEGERGLRAHIWASDEVFEQHLEAALA